MFVLIIQIYSKHCNKKYVKGPGGGGGGGGGYSDIFIHT